MEVGGGDEAHAGLEQRVQQAVQDHGVGHVRHVEFVETDQLVALGNACAELVQGVDRALQVAQLAVHLAHELVEMQPRLAAQRHRVVEAVHQEALAPPHPAEHVDPARDLRVDEHLLQRVGAALLVRCPLGRTPLQRVDGTLLGGVGGVAALLERGLVGAADRQGRTRIRSSACACQRPGPLPWSLPTARGGRGRCGQCLPRWP